MTARLFGLVAALVAVGLVLFGVFEAGRKVERATWLTKDATAVVAAQSEDKRSQQQANVAVAGAQTDASAARDFSTDLQREMTHVPVPFVHVAACAAPAQRVDAAVRGVGLVAVAPVAVASEPVSPAPDATPGLDDGSGVRLTVSAVRLWDSALAGRELPVGACSADAPASEACAAESDISLRDVGLNHAENAVRCQVDRSNYQHLIDFLKERQPPSQPLTAGSQ